VQWRAGCHGIVGIPGIYGNVSMAPCLIVKSQAEQLVDLHVRCVRHDNVVDLRTALCGCSKTCLHRTVKRSSWSTVPSALSSSTRQSPTRSLLIVLRLYVR
jgi:hypothetical protein